MQRALKRCKLPVWYTQGFNKRMYLSFVVPLSLGFESKYELLDMKLEEDIPFDEVVTRLNAVMPEGIHIVRVAEPVEKSANITSVGYDILLHCDNAEEIAGKWSEFLAKDAIVVEKKSKKGVISEVDLKPLMTVDPVKVTDEGIAFSGKYAFSHEKTMNPTQLIGAFAASLGIESNVFSPLIMRTAVYAGDKVFE